MNRKGGRSIAELVDEFLAAEKHLAGRPDWALGNRDQERRLSWPVIVSGEVTQRRINMTAYPDEPFLRFTITLNWPPCIWRVDFDPPHKRHYNPIDRKDLLGAYLVSGPSYHSWVDNRHLSGPVTLPENLDCARVLPANLKSFENVFRWFCGETNIRLAVDQVPELPPRTRLVP